MKNRRSNSISSEDAYRWMHLAQKLTMKNGFFSTADMYGVRGYVLFQQVGRKLGYLEYDGGFIWLPNTITKAMADIMAQEYRLVQTEKSKEKTLRARERQINQVDHYDQLPSIRGGYRQRSVQNPKKSWLRRFFGLPSWMKRKEKFDEESALVEMDHKIDELSHRVSKLTETLEEYFTQQEQNDGR